MFRKFLVLVVIVGVLTNVASAGAQYAIKEMTPAIKKALDARKERFSQIKTLKTAGIIGENNKGYVEVLSEDRNASVIIAPENEDRKVIYQAIAQQNGLEDALSTIELAFAQVQKEKADAGEAIQSEEGQWVTK